MKKLMLPAFAILLLFACHTIQTNDITDSSSTSKKDSTEKNYIPILDYIKAEIANVDSTPTLIVLYHIRNNKTDSVIIKTQEFDELAKVFLRKELDSPTFENSFIENSFFDQTTEQLNFTYTTKDSSLALKRADFLASPKTNGTDKMNSVYMEIDSSIKDSSVLSKMFWKSGRYFTILNIKQPVQGQPEISQTKVVWDRD